MSNAVALSMLLSTNVLWKLSVPSVSPRTCTPAVPAAVEPLVSVLADAVNVPSMLLRRSAAKARRSAVVGVVERASRCDRRRNACFRG